MECTNDAFYCGCEEHEAYWNAWAERAIKPIIAWLAGTEPTETEILDVERTQDEYAQIEAERELIGFAPLPRDLSQLTAKQEEACVRYFVSLPLSELRKRQQLTAEQSAIAYTKNDEATLTNLYIMEQHLAEAIMLIEWSDC